MAREKHAKRLAVHESFDRIEEIEAASNRSTGAVFTVVLGLVAAYAAWQGAASWPIWAGVAAVLALVTLLAPGVLAPLNRLWMRFALLLSRIMTPVVMAILFYGTVLPTGLLMRLFGKDPLRLKWQRSSASYWVPRTPPGPDADSLRNQF
jgi:hypothetical protein